ncbi:MAG: hypothetical protein ACRYGF_06925 [Janthinobacterium lividum]
MANQGRNGTSMMRARLTSPRPSWSRGAARLMDIGGTLRAYRLQPAPPRPAAGTVATAWERVGQALDVAMHGIDPSTVGRRQ